jgi:hypothetical protein
MADSATLLKLFKEQFENESIQLSKNYGLAKRGDLLTWWYFLRMLGIEDADIIQIVCDGGNDLGIDAVRIDENNYVHFYQFKNPESVDASFPEGDVDKVLGGLNLILARAHEKIANEELRGRIQEIYQSVRNGYRLHLVTSGAGISKEAKSKIENFVAQLKGPSEDFFRWKLEDLPYLQDAFYRKNLPTIQDPIIFDISQAPYQIRAANHDCYLFHSKGDVLAGLYNQHGEQLLQQNIRVYQGDKGTNASILKTCVGPDSESFLHYNNGVTFLCETAQWDGFTHKLTMTRAQIVNGGQTVRVLFTAHRAKTLRPNVLVPVRVLTSQGDKEFGSNVAVNLNNQNRIEPSFLRSNDPRVVQLANSLASLGWYLERRENEVALFTTEEKAQAEAKISRLLDGHVIRLKEGTQAYVSTYMRQPEMAKKNPKLMFLGSQDGGYFERIFNDELTAERFVSAQRLSWQVGEFVKLFISKKRRRDRVADWKSDYATLLGESLVANHGPILDQVIPQSVVFLCAITFEIEVRIKGRSVDEVFGELERADYSKIIEYLDLIIQFASKDKDLGASWPTLLKSQSFYDRFSSYLKGRLGK